MREFERPPSWLQEAVEAVMLDLKGAQSLTGVTPAAFVADGFSGVSLVLLEGVHATTPLPKSVAAEELDPEPSAGAGGNLVLRGLGAAELLVRVAGVLQEAALDRR